MNRFSNPFAGGPTLTTHHIPLVADSLHGWFSGSMPAVLTVASGDSITFSTLDGDWLTGVELGPPPRHGAESALRDPSLDLGHALIGPIAVEGAHPGMTLRVTIDRVETGDWGWSRSGGTHSDLDRALGVTEMSSYLRWSLDNATGLATSSGGHVVRMRPFMGVIGCAPDVQGHLSTHPPRRVGGNIDCKELVAGTRILLPIEVTGAKVSIGDGHAAQGDGEAGSTAIECPMRLVTVTVEVLPDVSISRPRAWTPDHWITFGFDPSLDRAATEALDEMVSLVQSELGSDRAEALNLCSQIADLRITQIVNGVKGVHAMVDHAALDLLRPPATLSRD